MEDFHASAVAQPVAARLDRLSLTGSDLAIADIGLFAEDASVVVDVAQSAKTAVDESKAFLDHRLAHDLIYGVNTGFGPMASHVIAADQLMALQENLIRSHAVGMGDPIPDDYVLAIMLVRLNTLAKGFSGVSWDLIIALQTLLNYRVAPVVPEHGAVGASGDLVQLAHIALALIGEGEVRYQGERAPAARVLARLGLTPHRLQPKEGLSLINGTSAMTGIAALLCLEAEKILSLAVRNGSLGFELVSGFDDGMSERFHSMRPHRGQIRIAGFMREILASSRLLRTRADAGRLEPDGSAFTLSEPVQEVYSFRCIPQILGPVLDALAKTWGDVGVEANAVTDNPIVDVDGGAVLHGGHFHGDCIASAVDQLKIGLVKLTLLSERRINFFLNRNANRRFPPFLNLNTPGLTLALQGLQFVATSTAARSQTLAFPHSIHSIPTNGDNQDVVSMGTDAVLLAMKVVENAYVLLAIEAVTLCQAVDCLSVADKLSNASRALYELTRSHFPAVTRDRLMTAELDLVMRALKTARPLHVHWIAPATSSAHE